MLKNIKTYFFIGFPPTILYNNSVGKQNTMPTNRHTSIPHMMQCGICFPCPLTNESPWGGFSCPYNAMTQWDMILVEKFTHNPLGFTPQWEYNICGGKT